MWQLTWGYFGSLMGQCFLTPPLTSCHGQGVSMGVFYLHAGEWHVRVARIWGRVGVLMRPCIQYSILWHRFSGTRTSGWKIWRFVGRILVQLPQRLCACSWRWLLWGGNEYYHICIQCNHRVVVLRSMWWKSFFIWTIEVGMARPQQCLQLLWGIIWGCAWHGLGLYLYFSIRVIETVDWFWAWLDLLG